MDEVQAAKAVASAAVEMFFAWCAAQECETDMDTLQAAHGAMNDAMPKVLPKLFAEMRKAPDMQEAALARAAVLVAQTGLAVVTGQARPEIDQFQTLALH